MKTAAIIAEYNPFHKGHHYHMVKTRELTGADYVVVIMSGDYVQRGEPACTDKYFRARMALLSGADLVIELPVIYATASAEFFAAAGVKLLDGLSCIDYLSFGSEWAGLSDFEPYADILTEEREDYQLLLQTCLKQGDSFPAARSKAIGKILSQEFPGQGPPDRADRFLMEPNHILGLEYLKALRRLGSDMVPLVIKREGAGYHEPGLAKPFPSASGIRKEIARWLAGKNESEEELYRAINHSLRSTTGNKPADKSEDLLDYISRGEYVVWDDLMPLLDYEILMGYKWREKPSTELLARIANHYRPGVSFDEVIEQLHSRNWTDTALKRELLHILLQFDREDIGIYQKDHVISVPYARVLGFRRSAAPLMKELREHSRIPLIQRPIEGLKLLKDDKQARAVYEADLRAAALYEQVAARKSKREAVSEFKRQQIIL